MSVHPNLANRLSNEDRTAIAHRITEAVRGWGRDHQGSDGDLLALTRLGAHAIGCSEPDLRDCELDEIRSIARGILPQSAQASS